MPSNKLWRKGQRILSLTIRHNSLSALRNLEEDAWQNFQPAKDVTVDAVWDLISSIYQSISNSMSLNTVTFCLGISSVKMPTGCGKG